LALRKQAADKHSQLFSLNTVKEIIVLFSIGVSGTLVILGMKTWLLIFLKTSKLVQISNLTKAPHRSER